jgi:outer membrane protein assembly factor BamB
MWIIALACLVCIAIGLNALIRPITPYLGLVSLGWALLALLILGSVSYLWTKGSVVPQTASALFHGFGFGLWVMLAGGFLAVMGSAVLTAAARSRARRIPVAESLVVIASVIGLMASGTAAVVYVPPALPALTCQAQAPLAQSASGLASDATSQTVYVTSLDHAYALRAADGAVRWNCVNPFKGLRTVAAPDVAQGVLYLSSLDGEAMAVRTEDGTALWHERIRPSFEDEGAPPRLNLLRPPATAPGPVAAGDVVYSVDGYSHISALRARDGSLLWRVGVPPSAAPLYGSLVASVDRLLGWSGNAFALDQQDGSVLWEAPSAGNTWLGGIVVSGETVYAEEPGDSPQGWYLVARSVLDGSERWRYLIEQLAPANVPNTGGDRAFFTLPFMVSGAAVYGEAIGGLPEAGSRPYVYALDARDGKPLWSRVIPGIPEVRYPGTVLNGVVAAGGSVYAAITHPNSASPSSTMDLLALRAGDGSVLWRADGVVPNQAMSGGQPQIAPASFTVAAGTLYLLSPQNALVALDTETGAVLWRFPVSASLDPPAPLPPPVVVGQTLYFSADRVYAVDAGTGTPRWTFAAPAPRSPFAVAGLPRLSPLTLGP